MRYIPHSPKDLEIMYKKIGISDVDELFDQIPASARFKGELDLPAALSEPELMELLRDMASTPAEGMLSFLGGGAYRHFIPSAVDSLLQRSEFYTAYTPYQPEISQGTLQAIFEFQTAVARIFNMQTANASMYDGATALVEAALMLRRVTRKSKIAVSAGIHPEYVDTLRTYIRALDGNDVAIVMVPLNAETGQTDSAQLRQLLDDDTACFLVGYPNFYGVVERLDDVASVCHDTKVRLVTSTLDVFAFGVLKPPGDFGVDVATAEGQSIAVPPSFGGPGLGLFAIADDKKLLRQMPGRLVGRTEDVQQKTGYVLTLATREQHIRREKATSNICTNHGLCALSAVVNISLLGKSGYKKVAASCLSLTEYLKSNIREIDGIELGFSGPTFNEFVVRCTKQPAAEVLAHLETQGILGGISLSSFNRDDRTFLVAVTELMNRKKLDLFISTLRTMK
ncbi:MAG: aminomethyl-transferring glycine dehydrogenase subunit GcvPA [Deltaproteobacteria bacterium]|nr:aminomethyl-transferring glycine dehydrogenase subunit GcvPA [Deltaproteobacteria bacterium]MBN2674073.1 aminomethyl-transferring glycine dehydrogenase subunit GcvPA [Deltaproteobacteria bacterium]